MAGKISLVEEEISPVHFFPAKYRNKIIFIDKVINVSPWNTRRGQGEHITSRCNGFYNWIHEKICH